MMFFPEEARVLGRWIVAVYFGVILLGVLFRFAPSTGQPPASVEPEAAPDTVVVWVTVRDTLKTPTQCLACHSVGISGGPHP